MWATEHSVETTASREAIWYLWSEVATWPDWNGDIARIEISGPCAVGSTISMMPMGADTVELRIVEVSEPDLFVDEADYRVTAAELEHAYQAISRRDGVRVLPATGGFVKEHRVHAARWDLARIAAELPQSSGWQVLLLWRALRASRTRASDDRNGRNASLSLAADGALALGREAVARAAIGPRGRRAECRARGSGQGGRPEA